MDERIRLYKITYEEDEETYGAVVPEWMLPEFEEIEEIEVVGRLHEELFILKIDPPEDPEKEPIPLSKVVNK